MVKYIRERDMAFLSQKSNPEVYMTQFNKLNRFVQILLLLIPGVNWITEVVVRWSTWAKKKSTLRLIICLLVTLPTGVAFGWLDLIWVLLTKKLFLQ